MRIAYIINSVEGGGAALPVPAIARVLRDAGTEVRVFALTGRDRLALPPMQAAELDPLVRDGGERDHVAALRWIDREVRAWGATHLWTSLTRATLLGLLIGRWRRLPVICWQHNAFRRRLNRPLLRLLQKDAVMWVADSEAITQLVAERLDVEPERLATWPIYAADPAMPEARAWQPGEPLVIGSLGRLHWIKGYDVLIEALALLRAEGLRPPFPIVVRIGGEGVEREALAARAAQAGIDWEMPGYVADPRTFLSHLHLYVQPSRSEGFCIAAHEAMTAGLPVLATRVGEMRFSVVPGETGALVRPGDAAALAEQLRILLSAPDRLHAMGQASRTRILDRFSQDRFAASGREIVNRVRAKTA